MNELNLQRLYEPFPAVDIEWRVAQCGVTRKRPWAKVLAYITARACQERLDEVFGTMGWESEYKINEFREYDTKKDSPTNGQLVNRTGVICTLSAMNENGDWIKKSDGAQCTDFEAFKGGVSDAFKRVCASGFGIGRYLYNLSESFAICQFEKNDGYRMARAYDRDNKKWTTIWWSMPEDALPEWALPGGSGKPERK